MKIVVIGAVAAGTSVIAKARRNDEKAEIVAYTSGGDISYSGCGIPYYVGEEYIERDRLTPRDAAWFESRFNMKMNIYHKVVSVDVECKCITILNERSGKVTQDNYDKLVVTTGARPRKIGFEANNVLYVRSINNGDAIRRFIAENETKRALIIGSGYIGMEMAENLSNLGIEVTIIEMADRFGRMDRALSRYVEAYLAKKGVKLLLNDSIETLSKDGTTAVTKQGVAIESDMIVAAIGVTPNVEFLSSTGIELGAGGAIVVNEKLETSLPDIYAAGDCATVYSLQTGEQMYIPMGSTANKMGRILGDRLTGGDLTFKGVLGTSIFKIFDMAVASTGLSEEQARAKGYDIEVAYNLKPNQTEYLASSRQMVIKAVADRATKKLLGVEIIGENGVDKRIDVFVTLITLGATVDQLFHLDLAYAPPFSTTKDPVNYTGMILENAISGRAKLITPEELVKNRGKYTLIDVRSAKQYDAAHIEGAINIPLKQLRSRVAELDKSAKYVTYCNKGVTGNMGQNILLNNGFETYNLSGGHKNYSTIIKN
ncbi:MAG: FAD-dependent oxidoreductase [Rikenellaceae bacterium]